MVEEYIRKTIEKFNQKAASDEKMKEELIGYQRRVEIRLDDGRIYNFEISNGMASDLREGGAENPEVVIETSAEMVEKLTEGELRIMKAYVTKKIRIKATLEDMLKIRKFF
ncbi:MAG: SCP2 sterol-binding domain-containing protein [Thermoplasmata archaeon]|nr:SCP2 sterol-binding domain-containing protein [Thermoplasmata archaeon]